MKKIFFLLFAMAILSTGCIVEQGAISLMNKEGVQEVSNHDLCLAYHTANRYKLYARNIVQEINQRDLLTKEEWDHIRWKTIFTGMSVCGLHASWGNPDTVSPFTEPGKEYSDRHQYVYVKSRTAREVHVYTEDERIIDYSD